MAWEALLTVAALEQIIARRYGGSRWLDTSNSCLIILLGHTATVFGATGFLGRYIVNRLGW